MKIIGITGGIASGKTTICNFLQGKSFPVHDSDKVVKNIYSKPSTKLIKKLKIIGLSKSINNNKIDKSIIRFEIFNNKTKKAKLEKYLHKEVKISREKFIKKHNKKKTKVIILDIPLLFEANLSNICDFVVLVYAPKKTKIERAIKRKGMTKKLILQILKTQLGDTYKKKKSDFVINTTKTKTHSFKMIVELINSIVKKECVR